MGLKVSQRRQRRDINEAAARKAYFDLLHNPTDTAIDDYISKFTPPNVTYTLTADDHAAARYLLAIVHCSYADPAYQVFLDVLEYRLNNDINQYKLEISKLEKRMLDKQVSFETEVKGPASKPAVTPQRVLSPSAEKGEARVRIV